MIQNQRLIEILPILPKTDLMDPERIKIFMDPCGYRIKIFKDSAAQRPKFLYLGLVNSEKWPENHDFQTWIQALFVLKTTSNR